MTDDVAQRIVANMDWDRVCAKCGDKINEGFAAIWWREHGTRPLICLQCFALGLPIPDRLRRWGFELWHSGGQVNLYRRGIDEEAWELLSDTEGGQPTDWNEPVMVARYADVLSSQMTLETECIEGPATYPSMYEFIVHLGATEHRMWCRECGYSFGVKNEIFNEAIEDPDGEYIRCPGYNCHSDQVEEAR